MQAGEKKLKKHCKCHKIARYLYFEKTKNTQKHNKRYGNVQ